MNNKSPYEILEIPENASDDTIRKAYLKKAKQSHPDKGGDEEMFKTVTASYEKIMNENNKSSISGLNLFENMFDTFFSSDKNLNIYKTIELTLEQFYTGYESNFTYKRETVNINEEHGVCQICQGNKITRAMNQINSYLNETGYDECYNCKGKGVVGNLTSVDHTIHLSVPKGCESNKKIVINKKGNENIEGEQGDFILQLKIIEHKYFTRKGNDLHKNFTISLKDSLLGFKYKHKPLDGKIKSVKMDGITKPGSVKRIRNLGMPVKNSVDYGDLYLHIKIKFPKTITKQQKETIGKIF